MGLFSQEQLSVINQVAQRSMAKASPSVRKSKSKISLQRLDEISKVVIDYFTDSKAELVTTKEQLHDYIAKCIEAGICAIDTETTGLDRIRDTIVGTSIYYPGGVEIYIPSRHIDPIFDEPFNGQLTYEEIGEEYQRLVDANVKTVWANADYDLAMIHKDFKVDMMDTFYYDVLTAWRCLKENEPKNDLKTLYNKYVLKGVGDPKKFSDFFPHEMYPYCRPEVAKLYAAHDAIITYELMQWQLPYVTKDNPKCIKNRLQAIADLVWHVEFPMVRVCQMLHRNGMYIEQSMADVLRKKYAKRLQAEHSKLHRMIAESLEDTSHIAKKPRPFAAIEEFNPNSPPHVQWLVYDLLQLGDGKSRSTDKTVLITFNNPVTDQILKIRSLVTLIGTFVEKLPNAVSSEGRIHCTFKSIGAVTGRMSSAEPNMQNLPSHETDIRRMFRATPGYVLMSSDFSQQEPKLTAYVSQDANMIKAFQDGKDIYSSIAAIAFNKSYDECREFTPDGEYNPEGKARRTASKSVVLGRRIVMPTEQELHYTNCSV